MKLHCDIEVYRKNFTIPFCSITKYFPRKGIGDSIFLAVGVEVYGESFQ
jgi:hypothetical protein